MQLTNINHATKAPRWEIQNSDYFN